MALDPLSFQAMLGAQAGGYDPHSSGRAILGQRDHERLVAVLGWAYASRVPQDLIETNDNAECRAIHTLPNA